MGKMSDLLIEIEEMYRSGYTLQEISNFTGMTYQFVSEALQFFDQLEEMNEPDFP